jgi:hypothetical protein
MKIICYFLGCVITILPITSCGGPEPADQDVARKSEPLRLALVRYYETNKSFPEDLELLRGVDSNLSIQANRWNNEWEYFSRTDSYNIWCYPGRTRRSLCLKLNPKSVAETGWFINNDDGIFQRRPFPLLPQEQALLSK